MKARASVSPHGNWRGLFEGATGPDTLLIANELTWPGAAATAYLGAPVSETPDEWLGSLVLEQADASGLLYRRARYYDPLGGQFTQPDPIGIAGGLNAYGYGGADPINHRDPFGLEPCTAEQLENGWTNIPGPNGGPEQCQAPTSMPEIYANADEAGVCWADVRQATVSGAMTLAMVSPQLRVFGPTAFGTSMAAMAGSRAAVAAGGTAGRFALNSAVLGPAMIQILHDGLSGAGSENPLVGRPGLAYAIARATPALGTGIQIGEAVNSCSSAIVSRLSRDD